MAEVDFLVDTNWLHQNIGAGHVRLLDGTWSMPGAVDQLIPGVIPGAQFFDIDEIAAPHPTLEHMLPSASQFRDANIRLGIRHTDHVICYDRKGVFSSPRLWWTYRMFGHGTVYVLDGGLPAWIQSGGQNKDVFERNPTGSNYVISSPLSGVIGIDEILQLLPSKPQIIDARSYGRFIGKDAEPREGLRSGHIPGSISQPYSELLQDHKFKPLKEIAEIIGLRGIDLDKPIITTCGSGITAAGLALCLSRLGATNVRVYDGSWAEYGASTAPIETDYER